MIFIKMTRNRGAIAPLAVRRDGTGRAGFQERGEGVFPGRAVGDPGYAKRVLLGVGAYGTCTKLCGRSERGTTTMWYGAEPLAAAGPPPGTVLTR